MRSTVSAFNPIALANFERKLERDLEAWAQSRFDLLPKHWQEKVKKEFRPRYRAHKWDANTWLRELTEPLERFRIPPSFSESDICNLARTLALTLMDVAGRRASLVDSRAALSERLQKWRITPPDDKFTDMGSVARMTSEHWLRRQLRKLLGRSVEQAAISAGLVHSKADIYISEDGYMRRVQQKRKNAKTLEGLEIVNEEGEAYRLSDIERASLANPRIRRGELMTRIRGFEEVAKEAGHIAVFVTLTCPSRFHSHRYDTGLMNSRYGKTNPREAQVYLCAVWARIRAKLDREGIQIYGFRVAEPHHDATPHWHMLLFLDQSRHSEFKHIFRHYALEDSPNEPGAQERRVEWVQIDPAKGTATGYIAKYISKNLDAHNVDIDFEGCGGATGAARVEAWAAQWGIRQFQQIGGPSVGIWRELRRLREPVACPITEKTRMAADNGDWAGFVQAMGGPCLNKKDRPIGIRYGNRQPLLMGEPLLRNKGDEAPIMDTGNACINRGWDSPVNGNGRYPLSGEWSDSITGIDTVRVTDSVLNCYGEPAAPGVVGLLVRETSEVIETRIHTWRFRRAGRETVAPLDLCQ